MYNHKENMTLCSFRGREDLWLYVSNNLIDYRGSQQCVLMVLVPMQTSYSDKAPFPPTHFLAYLRMPEHLCQVFPPTWNH